MVQRKISLLISTNLFPWVFLVRLFCPIVKPMSNIDPEELYPGRNWFSVCGVIKLFTACRTDCELYQEGAV